MRTAQEYLPEASPKPLKTRCQKLLPEAFGASCLPAAMWPPSRSSPGAELSTGSGDGPAGEERAGSGGFVHREQLLRPWCAADGERDSKVNRAGLVLQRSPGDHLPPAVQGRRSPGWQQLVGTRRRGKGGCRDRKRLQRAQRRAVRAARAWTVPQVALGPSDHARAFLAPGTHRRVWRRGTTRSAACFGRLEDAWRERTQGGRSSWSESGRGPQSQHLEWSRG